MKVAVIGSSAIVNDVMNLADEFPSLQVFPVPYAHERETLPLITNHADGMDMLLFTGPLPHHIAQKHLGTTRPMLYVPYTGTSLYRALFAVIHQTKDADKVEQLHLSIDSLDKAEIMECLEELQICTEGLFSRPFQLGESTDELVRFHYELWKQNRIHAAITCITSVFLQLRELGVNVLQITPTKSSIRNTLQRVILEGKVVQQSSSQIAIGIVGFYNEAKPYRKTFSEYEIQRKKLALHNVLLDYGEETQALVDWTENNEIRFVTTRGVIEQNTKNFKEADVLDKIAQQTCFTPSMGIGFGKTANEAEMNAHLALDKAKQNGSGVGYIMEQDGTLHGPLGDEFHFPYSLRSDDPQILEWAKRAGVSVGTMNRLLSFLKSNGKYQITSWELAHGFGISLRSARRILSKLENSHLVQVIGEEQPLTKGRPRQVYALHVKTLQSGKGQLR
ncbi:transcriptional regulator [Brevibacillus sp. AY1]|uniref:transcriptional regulator n=1 Tax=Brevibacillus sp. AY1 TaxID=2807621 RepID=UPI0024562244|nr:transcriptional regulator [Brevibacillus sp. AY1]MDH4619242.1 transcriptional regulator [Brevibacillus sp. AY1]